VELLLLILKGRRTTRGSALKCLDFACTRCAAACDRLVDQQGLKTLFAIFMGKLKVGRLWGRQQLMCWFAAGHCLQQSW
jgi:beta-catenin-like protein 1